MIRRSHKMRVCFSVAVLMTALGVGMDIGQAARRGPYLQNQQAQQVTICWEAPKAHVGEVRLFDADMQPVKQVASATAAKRHEVVVDGLAAGRRYSYEVMVGGGETSFGKGSFLSPPAKGEPFSFVAWGDTRSNERTVAALAARIMRTGAGMCLHTGDLVGDGKMLYQWDRQLFRACGALLRNMTLWPAVGNHDTGMMPDKKTSVFKHMFALPDDETFYSFDYGDAHFLVLDSMSPLDKQLIFAEEDLSQTNAKWKFAMWHSPPFSSGGHGSHTQSRERVLPILARHNVDMIITGHNHNFMLSKPIRHVYEPLQKRPYLQLVTGGGGANPSGFRENDRWFDRAIKAFHFVLIEIDGDLLKAKAIDANGRVLNRFEIDKSKPPQDAVAFELIELERYLGGLNIANTNLEGWPTGLVLKPDESGGQLIYSIRNPLPEPIKLRFRFDVSTGLKFNPETMEVEVPPGEQVEIEAPFEVLSPEALYPLSGPSVAFESSLGDGRISLSPPPIALGRKVVAHLIEEPISVDGEAKESAWSDATEHGRFVRWAISDLAYQQPEGQSTVRAIHDGQNLYLLLQRPTPRSAGDNDAMPPEGDHFSVYLASQYGALGIRADVTGEHRFAGTRGLDEGVVAAYTRSKDCVIWEVKIPMAKFHKDLDDQSQPLAFNVMEARGNEFFTLAPTFRQHPSRTSSATLILK